MATAAPLRVVLLDAQSVDETTSQPVDVDQYPYLTWYLQGTGTTSSGVVTFEESTEDPSTGQTYGGTWSSIGTVNASDVDGGKQKATHLTVGAYSRVRARISTAIGGGGTISVILIGIAT